MNACNHRTDDRPPILSRKGYDEASVFTPEALLREARRQKGIATGDVPEICILDPDGDIVEHVTATGSAGRHASWACYHTHLNARPVLCVAHVANHMGRSRVTSKRAPPTGPSHRSASSS